MRDPYRRRHVASPLLSAVVFIVSLGLMFGMALASCFS